MVKCTIGSLNRNSRTIFISSKWLIKASVNENDSIVEFEADLENKAAEDTRVETLRNKSRLLDQHRNMLHETTPYSEPQSWVHKTLKYQRKQYGKYGTASGADPRKFLY